MNTGYYGMQVHYQTVVIAFSYFHIHHGLAHIIDLFRSNDLCTLVAIK
jgi:hypothetical protein